MHNKLNRTLQIPQNILNYLLTLSLSQGLNFEGLSDSPFRTELNLVQEIPQPSDH